MKCSKALVDNIDALVSIEGLDGVVIGPYDLSGSYGLPGDIDHPTIVEAIQVSIDKCREAGIYVGVGHGKRCRNGETLARSRRALGDGWSRLSIHGAICGQSLSANPPRLKEW